MRFYRHILDAYVLRRHPKGAPGRIEARFDCDPVVAGAENAISDKDVTARVGVDAVSVGRPRWRGHLRVRACTSCESEGARETDIGGDGSAVTVIRCTVTPTLA